MVCITNLLMLFRAHTYLSFIFYLKCELAVKMHNQYAECVWAIEPFSHLVKGVLFTLVGFVVAVFHRTPPVAARTIPIHMQKKKAATI